MRVSFTALILMDADMNQRQPGSPAPQKQPLYEHLIQNYGLQSHKLCIRQAKIASNHPGIFLTTHAQHNSKHTPLQHHFVLSNGVLLFIYLFNALRTIKNTGKMLMTV
jgi:hypothetical protein